MNLKNGNMGETNHVIVSLTNDNKKIFKAAREKSNILYRGTKMVTANFLLGVIQTRRQLSSIFSTEEELSI